MSRTQAEYEAELEEIGFIDAIETADRVIIQMDDMNWRFREMTASLIRTVEQVRQQVRR